MNQNKKEQALQRVFAASGCRTQIELAGILGIKQSSISDAKKRHAIPAEWLIKLLRLKGINPDWVLYGEGEKYLAPTDTRRDKPHVIQATKVKPLQECSAQELINELVRRALQTPNLATISKRVTNSWPVVKKRG